MAKLQKGMKINLGGWEGLTVSDPYPGEHGDMVIIAEMEPDFRIDADDDGRILIDANDDSYII